MIHDSFKATLINNDLVCSKGKAALSEILQRFSDNLSTKAAIWSYNSNKINKVENGEHMLGSKRANW